MGAKQSAEMAAAKELVINQGLTPYEAAKRCRITSQAIYASKWYKDFDNEKTRQLQSTTTK